MYDTIEERTQELRELMAEIWPEEAEVKPRRQPTTPVDLDMADLMKKMFASEKGTKIKALYDGDWAGYPSQSEADLALMDHAAWWFDCNPDAMNVFMRGSGLYREKWERNDYSSDTIQRAIDGCKKTYQDGVRERRRGKPAPVSPQVEASPQNDGEVERPVIKWDESRIHIIIEEVIDELVDKWRSGETPVIFRRPEGVVRIGKVERNSQASRLKVKRDADAPMIYRVDAAWLHAYLSSIIDWQKFKRKSGWQPSSCPKEIVDLFLAKVGELRIPFLAGITNTPTMRPDGTILDKPGYDDETGLFFGSGGVEWPKVMENPTWREALEACEVLIGLLKEFPFKNDVSRSVALAYILTCLVRGSLPAAPGFVFDATMPGTGKTFLAHSGSWIARDSDSDLMVPPDDETEMDKRVTTLLMEGAGIIVIDNVMPGRPFFSKTLCAIMTTAVFRGRILGKSKAPYTSTNAVFAVTGNNLTLKGDATRRFLFCSMDAGVERPEERKFNCDLRAHIRTHRAEIVTAGLTILRAYFLAPDKVTVPEFGGFKEWSAIVREALVWCSQSDPCESKAQIEQNDPEREGLLAVLTAWRDAFGDKPATIKAALDPEAGSQELTETLQLVVHAKGKVLTIKDVGYWLRRHQEHIVEDMRFKKAGGDKNAILWKVVSS